LELSIDAVVDTAFSGTLALSKHDAARLKSKRTSRTRMQLADGVFQYFDTHSIGLEWLGAWRTARACELGDESLIGMRLLEGCELRVQIKDGGAVEITPLP
jgi:predicted aspartyl protease